ncbi:MAG: DUF1080 domain-containing protein [Planctomycetota bacterium]
MKTTKMRSGHFVFAAGSPFVAAVALALVMPLVSGQDTPSDSPTDDDMFDQRARPLFDGNSLIGWLGDGYWFHIQDDAIVAGRLEKRIPENRFLMTREVFADFDLRLEVRMVGPSKGPHGNNAGVQFRSRRPRADEDIPDHEMVGYQADMGSAWNRSVWGALYDESRRRMMLAEPDPPFEVSWSESMSDPDLDTGIGGVPLLQTPWVSMRILCEGPRTQIFMNGRRTVDYVETDDSIAREGHIALQIHSGAPAEAWYRNVRILMR